jgi:hypothetical protein
MNEFMFDMIKDTRLAYYAFYLHILHSHRIHALYPYRWGCILLA